MCGLFASIIAIPATPVAANDDEGARATWILATYFFFHIDLFLQSLQVYVGGLVRTGVTIAITL
jgi:NaMN:DMB phosphoribosyltransferase